jgi:hypothetical protein
MLASILAALLIQPAAPSALASREPVCVFDEMMAGERVLATAVQACRTRHGWSDAQVGHAVNVAVYTTRMLSAAQRLREAGVDVDALSRIYQGLSAADREGLASPADEAETVRLGRLIASRTRAAGITADSDALVSFFVYSAGVNREARLLAAPE